MADREETLEYLDQLRESGVTNTFGACPFVESELGVEYMETFAQRHQQAIDRERC